MEVLTLGHKARDGDSGLLGRQCAPAFDHGGKGLGVHRDLALPALMPDEQHEDHDDTRASSCGRN